VFSTFLLGGVLSAWWALSAVFQLSDRMQLWLGRYDMFGLLPCWSFFAPNPGTTDYRLVYRDLNAEGDASAWLEAPLLSGSSFRFIWHPEKHRAKALTDLIQILFRTSAELDDEIGKLALTWPYIAILAHVTSLPKRDRSLRRQFAVVSTTGHAAPRKLSLLFVSSVHAL
jgi:hypothetical protein